MERPRDIVERGESVEQDRGRGTRAAPPGDKVSRRSFEMNKSSDSIHQLAHLVERESRLVRRILASTSFARLRLHIRSSVSTFPPRNVLSFPRRRSRTSAAKIQMCCIYTIESGAASLCI